MHTFDPWAPLSRDMALGIGLLMFAQPGIGAATVAAIAALDLLGAARRWW